MFERDPFPHRHSLRSFSSKFVAHSDKYKEVLEKAMQDKNRSSFLHASYDNYRKHQSPPKRQLHFKRLKTLGSGVHSQVYLAMQTVTGTLYALKVISKEMVQKHKHFLQEEIKILSSLHHQNIIQLYHIFTDASGLNLVLEYGEETLFQHFSRKGKLPEKDVSRFAREILCGLDYMHTQGITHRDIKPENILLANGSIKICDFGFAKRKRVFDTKEVLGTMGYVSPQMITSSHYTNKTDLWAVGVIVYQLTQGKAFIPGITDRDKCRFLLKIQYPLQLKIEGSYLLEGFLKRILCPQEMRPEAYQLLKDPFILLNQH